MNAALHRALPWSIVLAALFGAQALWAASFPMTGQMRIKAPSSSAINRLVVQPRPSATALATVNQTGTAPMTITIAPNVWSATGGVFRLFPEFPNVAQLTSTFNDTHATLMFAEGDGPGTVNWCPKLTGCATFTQGTVAPALIAITPGASNFGGTLLLARFTLGSFVRVPDPPPPPVTIAIQELRPLPYWTAGLTKFRTLMAAAAAPKIYASPSFGPQGSILSVGAFVSTAAPPPSSIVTGFPMGTGRIFVIDATPPTPLGGPFSSSTTGTDARTASGNGNIVLVGGGVAYAGSTGNNFFRVNRLSLNLPEPASAVGLMAGALALVGLLRVRKRR